MKSGDRGLEPAKLPYFLELARKIKTLWLLFLTIYRREIMPKLPGVTVKKMRTAVDVSHPYAASIRKVIAFPIGGIG
jgi:hypothetical protein